VQVVLGAEVAVEATNSASSKKETSTSRRGRKIVLRGTDLISWEAQPQRRRDKNRS
jgi:hypothetical protein